MKILRAKPTLTYPLTDKQIVLDYVYHHFIVEKNPFAVVEPTEENQSTKCVYDTVSGGCAVGCLLPEDLRKRIGYVAFGINSLKAYYEGGDVEKHLSYGYQAFLPFAEAISSVFTPDIVMFLHDMQSAHDCSAKNDECHRIDNFVERLRKIAHDYKLSFPVTQN